MSLALRHNPGKFGLRPDPGGWVELSSFLAAMRISRAELDVIVAENDKQRFAVEHGPDGAGRIRANQGHSIPVELGLTPVQPPVVLYHGTSAAAVASIRATGIHRGGRHHVHLSADTETAHRVGARRSGRVAIITVAAGAMHSDGHEFYRSENGVWLTDAVPVAYLRD